jgi:4-hydroxy-tetrahydrodipicolinate synthase
MASLNLQAVRHYFQRVASSSPLPIVVQDYPRAAGFSMDTACLTSLLREVSGICAIKFEDAPSAPKIARLLRDSGDAAVPVFGGLGGVYLLEELLAGASGAMTGFAFPRRSSRSSMPSEPATSIGPPSASTTMCR